MDQDPKYFFIGIIVLALVAGLTFFLLWTSKATQVSAKIKYAIYLKEQSPAGLQKDGLVMMKGIKVGSVQDISFHPTDVERVIVEIEADNDAPIKTDTTATVRGNYITGLSYIDLIDSTKEAPLLQIAGENKNGRFIIPEGKTKLEELQNTLPEILENTNKLLSQGEKFLTDNNAQSIMTILNNSEKLTAALARQTNEIETTISSFATAANNLTKLTTDLNSEIQAILDQAQLIASDSHRLITKATAKFEQTGDSISNMAQSIKQGKETILGPTEADLLK